MTDAEQPLDLVPLPGSERPERPGFRAHGGLAPDTRVDATLVLRRRAELPESAFAEPLSRDELAERYGASPDDVELVRRTLEGLGVSIDEVDAGARRIRVSGPVQTVARVFGTDLAQSSAEGAGEDAAVYRQRTGGLSIPSALAGVVTAVLGLDDRPQARAQYRYVPAAAVSTSYTPPQLGTVYSFPDGTDGSGQTIAIIELGGGYVQKDLDTYFAGLGIPTPSVRAVGVDGGSNAPDGNPNGADGEVMLDIEVAGALAPKAEIVVYFAPNTDAGFLDAVTTAAHAEPTPAAISISWGQSEDGWTAQARTAFDQALQDAAALGVTTTAAAGDDGSSDRVGDGRPHVDFPASSPHALACGGTRLEADASTGAVRSEVVWNNGTGGGATGGGVSAVFPLPSWQAGVGVPSGADGTDAGGARNGAGGRGVPDVSAVADPQTGYRIRVDGQDTVIGGTSAVAPLWAALVARLAQSTGKPLGLLQPRLYDAVPAGQVADGFRDITTGDNGAYRATAGWDACTGLGVPDGARLLTSL
ncbi:S53 family peptidase [Leifsonia sp. 21MFCrub1.1]|uniref:S53 family peptidase n=1 Tax=Leifsonia sp. 21MFCrub1.1 TaxID=1798223 RepID=UPI0008928B19|nr:S53 family peptidase [Leifsonia sp. 21MFCrub1.1]SEA65172.1 kumamolisin. Serine peptidase. MEROPS family S53 [Leifsonia sp. 21MFCrub1.1]